MNQFGLPPICKACGRSLDAGEFTHVNCRPAEPPPEVPAPLVSVIPGTMTKAERMAACERLSPTPRLPEDDEVPAPDEVFVLVDRDGEFSGELWRGVACDSQQEAEERASKFRSKPAIVRYVRSR
jgi:hypothetical protein